MAVVEPGKKIEAEPIMMESLERNERGGMPLWAVAAALISAGLGCVAFLSRFVFVFSLEDYLWVDYCIECVSYLAYALAPFFLVLGFAFSRRRKGDILH